MSAARARGPFIVVGMGRSGTSYASSVLQCAGIDMGASLKPADEYNPRGYFEDVETTRMHEQWLGRRGLNLASVGDFFPLDVSAEERDAISSYVARRESIGRAWGVKSPGILFFWDAWRQALPPSNIVIVPFRHPAAVADSFERYGLDRSRALDLWLQLNELAIYAADNASRNLFLDFDDREALKENMRTLVGPFVDPYEPALRHSTAAAPLPGRFAEIHAELARRSRARAT